MSRSRRMAAAVAALSVAAGGPEAIASVTANPASVEQLASALDCTPSITVDAADFRQGVCSTVSSKYSMLGFATGKGQRDWLEYAQMYGGSYLVGERWIIAARPKEALTAARARLGGSIQETGTWGASEAPSTGAAPAATAGGR